MKKKLKKNLSLSKKYFKLKFKFYLNHLNLLKSKLKYDNQNYFEENKVNFLKYSVQCFQVYVILFK